MKSAANEIREPGSTNTFLEQVIRVMSEYDMQDDVTRRKVFWLLQRLTSWSLWKAKCDAFKVFAGAYETAIRTWPPGDPDTMEADHLKTIYEILKGYDQGLAELANGHRFVWRAGQALEEVVRKFNDLGRYFYRNPNYWERGQIAPYPPKVDALYQLMRASQVQMEGAPLEVWSDDNVANLEGAGSLLDPAHYDHGFYTLEYPTFPAVLPEVPDSPGPVIQSGQEVPCDGIWEPVTIESTRVLGTVPVDAKLFGNNGCFNYFVSGIAAPGFADVDVDTFDVTLRATHWRLLWEDRRYLDGVIPDESQYFLRPLEKPEVFMSGAAASVRTGDICPVSGEWRTEEYGGKSVHVERGAGMPDMLVKDSLGEFKAHWVTWRLVKGS
ncbi:immunity 43 family protein [Burkholderia cenocepacia]|uniref:Immunity 43 family protein n=1 Tax=Burkholderia cenocepacia TaxID=95486 RepID=A0AAN0RS61_9BURK|nr:immunity 43 family protein [Burkholderia cenocepacia]